MLKIPTHKGVKDKKKKKKIGPAGQTNPDFTQI